MVIDQIVTQQSVYIHLETTNQSFIDMHYFLKRTGRRNNDFFLALFDSGLAGVDPRDPNLHPVMKQRVLKEIIVNYWYFLREAVRIPVQGGTVSSGTRYQLNRGNLAMNFLFTLNYNMFVELPRQFGKTTAALVRYLWVYNFGSTNSEIMFIHKDHSGSKGNLKDLKEIRDALPPYLQMSAATSIDGKKLKVPNTVVSMQHPLNNNKITTFASARSRDAADKLGRGCTMPLQYYDEFAFMPYNQYAYTAAIPAYSTASENAKKNHAPYGILITTTPGDLTTEQGQYAYTIRNAATPWNEMYYDYSYEKLEELRLSNTKSSFFMIRYTYQQLGKGMEYFNKMCTDLGNDWDKIRREILLEWSKTGSNCPFRKEDLDIIGQYCRDPIRTILFGSAGQYQFNVYRDLDPRFPPIVGVDVAGAMYMDSSAITVVDSYTTEVTATLNCNYIPSDDLADVIYVLVKQYMPNAVVNVELNGGFGRAVVERLVKTSIKKNLYFEIKEKVIEEAFNGYRVNKNKQLVKIYGTTSTREVRARLIEILYDRVNYHKDKFIAKILHDEMEAMEVKKNGKVEHSDTSHDDQVFSYLMALYVWYDGKNLMENFGIQRNTIMTDDEVEIVESEIDSENSKKERIDLDQTDLEEVVPNINESLKYVQDACKIKLGYMYNDQVYTQEQDMLDYMLSTNKAFKNAYNEKYHNDSSNNTVGLIKLPDSLFLDDEFENEENNSFNGNLYNIFDKL